MTLKVGRRKREERSKGLLRSKDREEESIRFQRLNTRSLLGVANNTGDRGPRLAN